MTAVAPLRIRRFRSLWIAAIFSNLGSFFQAVAGAWLMKELTDSSATWVGLMIASNTLPLLFLALISGVVADLYDRTKVMLASQIMMGLAAGAMALTTWLEIITPGMLLALGLVLGIGVAFNLPAWQSLVPDLVPRGMVASAVALNSAGFNVARAVGPALGGLAVATIGPAFGFAVNAASYLGVVVVAASLSRRLTGPERTDSSISTAIGLSVRYTRFHPPFRRLLALVALFALTSSVVQAVLPNRTDELGGDEATYGLLLGAMGAGALVAALLRQSITGRLGRRSVPSTIFGFGVGGLMVGLAPGLPLAFAGMFVTGIAWVLTLTTLNATSQLMAPEWVRGRAMSLYMLSFSGTVPIGSIAAGALADSVGAGTATAILSTGAVMLGVASSRFRVPWLGELETPEFSDDRPEPTHADTEGGPVMILNTWILDADPGQLERFLETMQRIRLVRLRTGAYRWRLYRNADNPHRLTEMFLCVSWDEHVAQHRRIDDASARLLIEARDLDIDGAPRTRHLVAVDLEDRQDVELLMAEHDDWHRHDGSIPLDPPPEQRSRTSD